MTDSKALIERLRRTYPDYYNPAQASTGTATPTSMLVVREKLFNPDGPEAADHIEKLEADKALLREALIRIDGHYTDNPCATAEEAYHLTIEEMAQMARAALQETSHDA